MNSIVVTAKNEHTDRHCHCSYCSGKVRTSQRTQCSSTDTLTADITYSLLLLNVLTNF